MQKLLLESTKEALGRGREKASARGGNTMKFTVKTTRLDNVWRVIIEHGAESMTLPHRVVEQIVRHRESIITAQCRDLAVERAQQLVRPKEVPNAQPNQHRQKDGETQFPQGGVPCVIHIAPTAEV